MKKVVVTINPVGKTTIDAQGFNGVGCAEATEKLEKALAGDGQVERVKKPEWDQLEVNTQDHNHITW